MIDYSNYLITENPSRYRKLDWLENIEAAIAGGVTVVQYRDTENKPRVVYERILRLQDLLKARKIPLVVNNYPDIAAVVKAEAVHVGQSDLPTGKVREVVGPNCEIGLSITDLSQVPALLADFCQGFVDFIGVGPVYDCTNVKADAAPEMGLDGLAAIAAATPEVMNCGVGGVTLETGADMLRHGAKTLAIIEPYAEAEDPEAVARGFGEILRSVR